MQRARRIVIDVVEASSHKLGHILVTVTRVTYVTWCGGMELETLTLTTGKGDVQSCSENATGHRVQLSVRCSDRCLIWLARVGLVRPPRQSAVLDWDVLS